MSDTLRTIDARIRLAMRGTERIRGVVVSTPVAGVVSVRVADGVLPALVPASAATVVGSVVELYRPRGIGGQLHIAAVL